MKLQKVPVLAVAFLIAMLSPQAWAFGHGGGGGGRGGGFHAGGFRGGGFRGGFAGRGGFGCRGRFGRCGGFNRRGVVFATGGGYLSPIWGGYGGYGGYGDYDYPYGSYPYPAEAAQPSYNINYSPYITTDTAPAPTAPVAEYTGACPVQGDLVGNVQRALRQRGFYKGPIDGVSGAPTRAAIRAYAASSGFSSTGIIDCQLLSSLGLMGNLEK